jgi:hypothetical protein
MSARPACSGPRILVCLALASGLLAPAAALAASKKTHLGVPSKQIVNLETNQVPNDNSGGALFRYDRSGAEFAIPPGYSFVVTDVLVQPANPPNTTDVYLVVLNFGGRLFEASFVGSELRHYPLVGGMVINAGAVPDARNTTSSSAPVDVQLLGYFVKGEGLDGGESLFPAPAE